MSHWSLSESIHCSMLMLLTAAVAGAMDLGGASDGVCFQESDGSTQSSRHAHQASFLSTRAEVVAKQGLSLDRWSPKDVSDLAAKYNEIFMPSLNRNAASHLWVEYILSRSLDLTHDQIEMLFSGFCPVSGSPTRPAPQTRYKSMLAEVGGGVHEGYTYHCCWPCICDTVDLIKVDTKTITAKDGVQKQYLFTVIGNPCASSPPKCTKTAEARCIPMEAPAVVCTSSGELEKAVLSDHGHVIIGMHHDANITNTNSSSVRQFIDFENTVDQAGYSLKQACKDRKQAGFNSGMGAIFQQVASITPIK